MLLALANGATTEAAAHNYSAMYNTAADFFGYPHITHAADQVAKWFERWQDTGGVDDADRSGRRSKMPDRKARILAAVFKAGAELLPKQRRGAASRLGLRRPFTSMRDACANSPQLQRALTKYGYKHTTLLRRLLKADPDIVYTRIDYKSSFTAQQKAERISVCKELYRNWPVEKLRAVTWIDCASFVFDPAKMSRKGYVSAEARATGEVHTTSAPPATQHVKLRFLVAINAVLGPVWIECVSGTTDLKRDPYFNATTGRNADSPPYQVSSQQPCKHPCLAGWVAPTRCRTQPG
jgi:hypothetical protein